MEQNTLSCYLIETELPGGKNQHSFSNNKGRYYTTVECRPSNIKI